GKCLMTTLTASMGDIIQGVGAQGTPQAPERLSTPTAQQRQAMQDAARQMRDAIRANVNEQAINAQASAAAARALRDQGVTIVGAPNIQGLPAGVNQDGPITI